MADTFSDIAKNASSMSVTELGSSLLGRKEATQKAQNKRMETTNVEKSAVSFDGELLC